MSYMNDITYYSGPITCEDSYCDSPQYQENLAVFLAENPGETEKGYWNSYEYQDDLDTYIDDLEFNAV